MRAPTTRQPTPAKSRPAATLAAAAALCPDERQADRIADTFGLDQVASAEIRTRTRHHLIAMTQALQDHLGEKAIALHLQRVVAAFVTSALRTGEFYSAKSAEAQRANARLHNDDRDEDRPGIWGFESRAERTREFAARLALQAHAVLAAAEGAAAAFHELTGSEWRPWTPTPHPAHSLDRRAAEVQLAAFQRR